MKDSIKKIYNGNAVFETHLLFMILSMIMSATFLFFGEKSFTTLGIFIALGFLFQGYYFTLMHNTIKETHDELPDIGIETILVVAKAIPIYLVIWLAAILLTVTIGLIPLVGPLIAGILISLLAILMQLQYCENFKLPDAFNFKKINALLIEIIVPYIILNLKLLLVAILCLTPIAMFAAFIGRMNPFVGVTFICYFSVIIFPLVYYDNLAQIYTEITFDKNEKPYTEFV